MRAHRSNNPVFTDAGEKGMNMTETTEFERIARSVGRNLEGFKILDITGTTIQACVSGDGRYRCHDQNDFLEGNWSITLPERDQIPAFGVEMYSRLNHNEELPHCSRCESPFIPSHTERAFLERFGDEETYQKEYASKSLCELCAVDLERMHRSRARKKEAAESRDIIRREAGGEIKINRQPVEEKSQKAAALYRAEVFYKAALETDGFRITAFNDKELQIEISLRAQYDFYLDADGRYDYAVSLDSDSGKIIKGFLERVSGTVKKE